MSVLALRSDGEPLRYLIDLSSGRIERATFRQLTSDLALARQRVAREIQDQRALSETNEKLRQFAQNAAHEIRSPLGQIIMCLDESQEHRAANEPAGKWIEAARQAADRLNDLVATLLQYAETVEAASDKRPTSLASIVKEAATLASVVEPSGDWIRLGTLPVVHCEPASLTVAIKVLLENARKYRSSERTLLVRVDTDLEAEGLTLSVRDNGQGFDGDLATEIFRPFVRTVETDAVEGFGIGLAQCQDIVARHGWKISAEGRPGEGASFFIHIPRRDVVLRPLAANRTPSPSTLRLMA